MLASDIPQDVWLNIVSHVVHPKNHIILSQICQTSRAIYNGEDKWMQLCRSIGIGRGTQEKKESWKKVFVEVIAHRERCRVPQCWQYGVPPMYAVGDLLPSRTAVMEHMQHFEDEAEREKAEPPEEQAPIDSEQDAGVAPTAAAPADSANPPVNDNATIAAMPGPLSWLASLGLFPPIATGDPSEDDADGGEHQEHGRCTCAVCIRCMGCANCAPPPVPARLLPLSSKNRDYVPAQPELHTVLRQAGGVPVENFLTAEFALVTSSPGPFLRAMDWDDELVASREYERLVFQGKQHCLLMRAFATNPPVAALTVTLRHLSMRVVNKYGVTVQDVIFHLDRYLAKPIKEVEKGQLGQLDAERYPCRAVDWRGTRLEYLLQEYAGGTSLSLAQNVHVLGEEHVYKTGRVEYELFPTHWSI